VGALGVAAVGRIEKAAGLPAAFAVMAGSVTLLVAVATALWLRTRRALPSLRN